MKKEALNSALNPRFYKPRETLEMAARTLFLSLTRKAREGNRRNLPFRSLSSSPRSEVTAVGQESVTRAEFVDDDKQEEQKDVLKSRIFRVPSKRSVDPVLMRRSVEVEGGKIPRSELRTIIRDLRNSQRYKHAFELSRWMFLHEDKIRDSDRAIHIDLLSKVDGIDAAKMYFEAVPKTSETYTALLHSYARLKLIEQAEDLFEQIKGANLSFSAITYNELMTLYMSVGQLEKVPPIITEMKSKNVSRDLFTYNLWISSCAAALNVDQVTEILDQMSIDPGCDENWTRYKKLVQIYISTNFSSVVETEKGLTQRELISYDFLVILFGGLGNKVKIDEIWKSLMMTTPKMTRRNYICVLSSYLMLGHLKEAAHVVNEWQQSTTSEFNISLCNKLVEAFKEVGMSDKATSLQDILNQRGE